MTRSRKLVLVALLTIILVSSLFIYMKLDFDSRNPETLFLNIEKNSPSVIEALQKLGELTPADAVVFSWWDYGRAIEEFGGRKAVVAHPSRDIIQTIGGVSKDPIYSLEMQLFGTFESSEKIRDVAKAFVLPEDESLAIMREYGATHVMVFCGTENYGVFYDPWKFVSIAGIAGYDGTEYIQSETSSSGVTLKLTSKSGQSTMLRLIYDEFQPEHFTKIYENKAAKVYRIEYPTSNLVESTIMTFPNPGAYSWLSTTPHPRVDIAPYCLN